MSLAKAGPFELLELLGEGGVGQVYSARDPVLGRHVAIKMLRSELSGDREFRDRFHGEAQRLGDLNHANITTLYGLHVADDKPFMVMELVRGRTLKALREAAQRLPPRESLAVLAQTLAGLAYAHRAGVIHRDIKPSNLMITEGGIVKIMDFGIARVRGAAHMTRAGQALLTPLYASPEQIKGEEVDERSDLYSLGVVFYEMLAGRPPFTAKSEYLLERAHLEDPPPLLAGQVPGLDPPVEAAVMRALAKNPGERFASAEEFGRAVGARAIRGDAPDILQEFLAAAFREAPSDETRRIGRTSGTATPLVPEAKDKNPFAALSSSRPSPIEGGEGAGKPSSLTGEAASERARPAPADEPRTVLPEDSLRTGGDENAAARAPAEAFSLRGAGISLPPDPPAAGAIRTKPGPAAASLPRLRARAPLAAAVLGAIVLALALGYAGLRSWGPAFFAGRPAPEPVAAARLPTRPNGSSPHPGAAPPSRAALNALPKRTAPPPSVATLALRTTPSTAILYLDGNFLGVAPAVRTLPPGKHRVQASLEGYQSKSLQVDLKPGQTLPLDLELAPMAPPHAAPLIEKPATTPRTASAAPSKPAPPVPAAVPAPLAKTAAPEAIKKPAAPLRIAAAAPASSAPPKPMPPLGPPPLPRPRPDLEGVVQGAMSASMIKIGGHWIELYGVDDPTRGLRRHIAAVAGYLGPARGRVACYRKAARKYQCYADGKDLALLALRAGIARPARDAPADYREAALRREPHRKQP